MHYLYSLCKYYFK